MVRRRTRGSTKRAFGSYDGLGRTPQAEAIRVALAANEIIRRLPSGKARRRATSDLLSFFSESRDDFSFLDLDFDLLEDDEDAVRTESFIDLRTAVLNARLRPRSTALDKKIDWLRRLIGLNRLETAILAVGLRCRLIPLWEKFHEAAHNRSGWLRAEFIAQITGFSESGVREHLCLSSRLIRTGLLENHRDGDFAVSALLIDLVRMRGSDPRRLESALLRAASPSSLAWEDFDHVPERDLVADLVAASVRRRNGVNILFHGVHGTGKSEFARALANHVGLTAHFIGETDDEGGEPSLSERLAHLSMVRALVRPGDRRLTVIDEADDLMTRSWGTLSETGWSKLWLNQTVESSVGPTIWVVNDPEVLGPAVIRRMTLAVGFRMPPECVRTRVAERQARALGMALAPNEAARLGAIKVAPAITASALRAAALTGSGVETAVTAACSIQRALGRTQPPERLPDALFDPALSCSDSDLIALAERLSTSDNRNWSLLLSGPPGTGKSAYARFLAKACGIEVIERRASDLLGMFVGQTEQAIAEAFREAVEARALLIFDEADSMLRDRRSADRVWEVSMVNEMLSWMESHPLPFVATTNLVDCLDPATSRRFLFKIVLKALDAPRARLLFERSFGQTAPAALERIDDLVPSDFSVVARRARFVGAVDASELVAMLRSEVEARAERRGRIGFGDGRG